MREIDRVMISDLGITLLQMMENAGRNLADVIIHTATVGNTIGDRVVVTAGPGGNGGGGKLRTADYPGHWISSTRTLSGALTQQKRVPSGSSFGPSTSGAPTAEPLDFSVDVVHIEPEVLKAEIRARIALR